MPSRFLVYPLLFFTLAQLATFLRHEPRWFLGSILQRVLILGAAAGALLQPEHRVWLVVAWGLLVWFAVLPRLAANTAMRWLMAGEIAQAANAWQMAARLIWGRPARLQRRYATALELWSTGQHQAAETLLRELDDPALPATVQGEVRLWRLWLFTATRQWPVAVEYYESVETWGSLATALQARLAVARAYAELGQIEPAIRCLVFMALSPRTVGALAEQLWTARICLAALAGDQAELEQLLTEGRHRRRRGWVRFIAVWRGRCALRRGDRDDAGRQLARALALTPATSPTSRAIITGYLERLDEPRLDPTESGRAGFALLRDAVQRMGPWRDLMDWTRPAGATLGLLIVISGVYVLDVAWIHYGLHRDLWEWAGNLPLQNLNGEWWRPATALFLHAGWLHLVLNGAGLWMFGTAIEKSMGWGRMLVVFIGAGTAANVISAYLGGFDVSVGASGGINGLVAAFGVAVWRLNAPIQSSIRRRLLLLLGILFLADLTIGHFEPQIDNTAHVGGFVVGFLLALPYRIK